jgi:hypothetical protein
MGQAEKAATNEVHVFVNRKKLELDTREVTGAQLLEVAGFEGEGCNYSDTASDLGRPQIWFRPRSVGEPFGSVGTGRPLRPIGAGEP